jgi:uncharacterized protein (TIRG00374 family)
LKNLFNFLKIAVFALAIVFLVIILKNGFNSAELKALILKADYSWIFFGVAVSAVIIVLKGMRLQIISKPFEINFGLAEFIKIQLISITFAIITPGRAGEFTKIYLLAKEKKEHLSAGTVICVFERLLDFLVLTLMSLLLCINTLKSEKITYILLFSAIAFLAFFYLLFKMEVVVEKMAKILPEKIRNFLNYFVTHKSKLFGKLAHISVYTTVIWCLDGYFQWTLLRSIGSDNPLLIVIGINAIVSIMSILTVLPLGLGTMDFSALFLYSSILKLANEKIVFLLGAARIFSISTLLIMLMPMLIFQKDFLLKLFSDLAKKKNPAA